MKKTYKEYQKEYYKKNKKTIKAKQKEYYKKNKETIVKRAVAWNVAHPKEHKFYVTQSYLRKRKHLSKQQGHHQEEEGAVL